MNTWHVLTYVEKSNIHGVGRFAEEYIAKGNIVLYIDGDIYKNENKSYINHSLQNNLDFIGNNTWIANKDIQPRVELTMNYLQWIKSVPF